MNKLTAKLQQEMTGNTFGRLTVKKVIPAAIAGTRQSVCVCVCECGNNVTRPAGSIRTKKTLSCGCLLRDATRERRTTHGMSFSSEHQTWVAMQARCLNPNNKEFHNYGGRGITICKRWLGKRGLQNFVSDMGKRPSSKHSLDRYPDMNGDYKPSNCRWATPKEQTRNCRRTIFVTIDGLRQPLIAVAEERGLSATMLAKRYRKGIRGAALLVPPKTKSLKA